MSTTRAHAHAPSNTWGWLHVGLTLLLVGTLAGVHYALRALELQPLLAVKLMRRADDLGLSAVLIVLLLELIALTWGGATRRIAVLLAGLALLTNLLGHGKLESLGVDSVSELSRTNAAEAWAFVKGFVLVSNYAHADRVALGGLTVIAGVLLLALRRRSPRWASSVSIAGLVLFCSLLAATHLRAIFGEWHKLAAFESRLRAVAPEPLSPAGDAAAPNIVVIIGESMPRDSFLDAFKAPTAGATVVFDDVISAHSHTFPSLLRALTLSRSPLQDQFVAETALERQSVVDALNRAGKRTEWYTNQSFGDHVDWIAELFGRSAKRSRFNIPDWRDSDARRPLETELFSTVLASSALTRERGVASFVHTFAGHWDYCAGIPGDAAARAATVWTLPTRSPEAFFGNLPLLSATRHLRNIACHHAAVAYNVAELSRLLEAIDQSALPIVALYFPDHGEDVYDGSAHDSSRNSFRHIEVPLILHFNPSAHARHPGLVEAASRNSHVPYSLEWVSDTILDLQGLRHPERPWMSLTADTLETPARFSLLRTDVDQVTSIVAVDRDLPQLRGPIRLAGHDFFARRRMMASLSPDNADRICGHRNNSLLKFQEAARLFRCLEVDVVIDVTHEELQILHPPKPDTGLSLRHLLSTLPSGRRPRLWLDVKNLGVDTVASLHRQLNALFPPAVRREVFVETGNSDARLAVPLAAMVADGYPLSYYLDADRAAACQSVAEKVRCAGYGDEIAATVERLPFTDLSYEIVAHDYLQGLRLSRPLRLNTWDLRVQAAADIRPAVLKAVDRYIVPYRSRFDY